MLNYRTKTPIRLISLILAQVFLFTGVVYPESTTNKNTSSIYIQAKDLRVPMMGSGGKSRLERAIEKAKELQPKPRNTSLPGTTCLFRCPSEFRELEERLPEILLQKIRSGDRKLSVLSLGASTGEEAVSIATTILAFMERRFPEEDVGSWNIVVRGVEIRPAVVKQARERLKSGDFESGEKGNFYTTVDENYLPYVILQEGEGLSIRNISSKVVKRYLPKINELNIVQFQEGSIVSPQVTGQIKEADIVFFNMVQYQLTEDRGIPKDAALNLGRAIQGFRPGSYLFTTSSPEELTDKRNLNLDLSEFDMDIIPVTNEVVLRKREPSAKNLSLASGETISVQAFADDGPVTIYLDKAGIIQDINEIANGLGLNIQFAGGVARRMLLGRNPIIKGSDLDITIQASAANPYAGIIARMTPELTKRINSFRKILDEKYHDLEIDILNVDEDLLDKPYAGVSRNRSSTLDRMLIQEAGGRWIVTDETGGKDPRYIENVRNKYLCLVPKSADGPYLTYEIILRFMRIKAEFPEVSVDKKSLKDINKFLERGLFYEDDTSRLPVKDVLDGFLRGDEDYIIHLNLPPINTLLKVFVNAKDPYAVIELLGSMGTKRSNLAGLFSRIVDLNELAGIALEKRGTAFDWSDFDRAFSEKIRENGYAKKYSEKEFGEFLSGQLTKIFPKKMVPGDDARIREFAVREHKHGLMDTNKMSIERRIAARYYLVNSWWQYFMLGQNLREGWFLSMQGKVSEEFYEHIQANEQKIRSGINQGKYRNLLDYYFKEFRPLDGSDERAKGSPLNLAKYLIAHKNYRGNPISIEDLRKVRINQETGWSYADSTIYLEINSLKEIGILESVDRGRYALSEEFTMDRIKFIDEEIRNIIDANSPEGKPLGLDRYRLDDLGDEKIELMREAVMRAINNIREDKKAFREGELFYLGDKAVNLDRLMPLAEAIENSLDSIDDRNLDTKGAEDKKILKRGLLIAAGDYSPKHPEERHLDIVIKDDLGRDVAKIKVWPLKLKDGLTFSKKGVFLEWLGIDMGWMKGKGVVGQVIYSELSKLLYELGYREIYGYRKWGSEGFWEKMGWKPSDVAVYIPGTPGFYIEKPDSVKGHCPSIVELYKGSIESPEVKPIEPQSLASNQNIRPMSRRTFLSKSAKTVAGAAVLTAVGVAVYKSGEPSPEQTDTAVSLKRPIHTGRYVSKLQFEQEKKAFIAAKSAGNNVLGREDAEKAKGFLTPNRVKAIQFAAKAWKLEPALIAGFAYEEKIDKDSKNSVKEGIKERISKMFGLRDMRNTVGGMNVSASFMKRKAFLDFLYENRDFIMDQLLDNESDKAKFMEFIKGDKNAEVQGYEFIGRITERGQAWNAWVETIYPILNNLAEVDSINILLGAHAMRIKAGEIARRNKNVKGLPDISTMSENSGSWLVEDYMEIPAGLKDRYSVFNSNYYPPYAYHYFLAVDYTGIKTLRERAVAKVNAYVMFEKSAAFKTSNAAELKIEGSLAAASLALSLASNSGISGPMVIDTATQSTMLTGEDAKTFLMSTKEFMRETIVCNVNDSLVTVSVDGEDSSLEKIGIIQIKPGAKVAFKEIQGPVVVIVVERPEGVSSWYRYYGPASFSDLFNRFGYNDSGLISPRRWVDKGVMVFEHSKRVNQWTGQREPEWLIDSMALGTPLVGVSMVSYQEETNGWVDFHTIRPAESLHSHPDRNGGRMNEIYYIQEGAAVIVYQENGEYKTVTLKAGEMFIVDDNKPHAIIKAKGPYKHLAIQIPPTFQYGFDYKDSHYVSWEELSKANEAQHASWAQVEQLSPENYDESNLMLDEKILIDQDLISELRVSGRSMIIGAPFGLNGNRFVLEEVNGQKVLVSKDIIDSVTEGEAMAILADALSKTRFINPNPELPLVIASLYKSPRLFEDCRNNGFIGINQAFLKLYNKYKDNPEIKQYLKIILQTGLEHEIRHEAGMTDESELKAIDARAIIKSCNANNMHPEDLISFLGKENIIDEDFIALLYFYSGVENSLAEIKERWRSDPGSFMTKKSGQKSVERILEYMRKDPGCYVSHGDMSKIGVMNYALTREIVDKLIPIMANAADLVISKYKGAAVSITGDEVCLVLPSSLGWKDVNAIRLELQAVLAYFLEDEYMFCKVITTADNDILGSDGFTGIYQDKDGSFMLFPKGALSELSGFLELTPLNMPSPRLNFGIVRASSESEDVHTNYGVSMSHAEYVLNVSKEAGFHGGTQDTLGDKDRFKEESESPKIPRLTDEERKKIADEYTSRGLTLHFDQIEEYYPAVKRDYLYYVLKGIASAQVGTIVLVRGPPDNFYIVKKIDFDSVAFMKLEFVYEPGGDLKNRVSMAILEGRYTRDSLRSRRWLGAYGFKVINEFYGHWTANTVILEETKFLNKLLGDNFNFAELDEEIMSGLQGILDSLGVETKPMTVLSTMRLNAQEIKVELIDDIDDIGKVREDIFTFKKKSGNIVRLFTKARRQEFEKLRAKERAKDRRKFSYILTQTYREPALNANDFSTLQKNHLWQTQPLEGVAPLKGVKGRVYVIGDVHADLNAVRDTLEGIGFIRKGSDENGMDDEVIAKPGTRVVQGGDLPDRGPKSIETVKYMRYLQDAALEKGCEVIRIIGNHEILYLLKHAEGRWSGLVEKFKREKKISGFDENIWANDEELVGLIRDDISKGRLIGVYELGGTLFSHGVITPGLTKNLSDELEDTEDADSDLNDPVIFTGVVNSILKKSIGTNNFDSVIYDMGGLNSQVHGISSFYFKELNNFADTLVDSMPFSMVVFHDPHTFIKAKKIPVKKGEKKNISIVCADVGMTSYYDSGRAAVVFENGIATAAYPVVPKDTAEVRVAAGTSYQMLKDLLAVLEDSNLKVLLDNFLRLETSDLEAIALEINNLLPEDRARIAYHIKMFEENNIYLSNFKRFFKMPEFYKNEILAQLSILPYSATYYKGEELKAVDFGEFELIGDPVKDGEDYIFKFGKENAEYTVRLKKDFSLELESNKTKDALASNESIIHEAAYLDENACRQLSGRVTTELKLSYIMNKLNDIKGKLPEDAKLKYGLKEYGWEEWRESLPVGGKNVSEEERYPVCFIRVGYLFFLDESKYQSLSDKLKEDLGANVIRIRDMHKTDLGARGMLTFTMAAIAAMMESDMSGKQVIDAGAGYGTLSLVAIKLGVAKTILIEKDVNRIQQAAENLRINGLADGVDYMAVNADLADTDDIAARVTPTDLETVIISNIGTWPEIYGDVTNADSMRLIAKVPNVVAFIGGGYPLGAISEASRKWKDGILTQDKDLIAERYNFNVNPETAVFQAALRSGGFVEAVAWLAKADNNVAGQKRIYSIAILDAQKVCNGLGVDFNLLPESLKVKIINLASSVKPDTKVLEFKRLVRQAVSGKAARDNKIVLIFDMDGTLYASDRLDKAYEDLRYEFIAKGLSIGVEEAKMKFQAVLNRLRQKRPDATLGDALKELGLSSSAWNAFGDSNCDPRDYLDADAGLKEELELMRSKGYEIVIATHNSRYQAGLILEALGIKDIVGDNRLFVADERELSGIRKPNPEFFKIIAKSINADPLDCISIGDRLLIDVFPGEGLGTGGLYANGPQYVTLESIEKVLNLTIAGEMAKANTVDQLLSQPGLQQSI